MRAVGYTQPGLVDGDGALIDIELPEPEPGEHDLLVAVQAVSVSSVDCRTRTTAAPPNGEARVLGWDAVGTVVWLGDSVGCDPLVEHFKIGDRVYYAGAFDRQGTDAEYHLVDARFAAHAPASLTDAHAAALPLASLTAWEMLFDRLEVTRPVPGAAPAVVIIGAAGGVGSMAIQLLRARTHLTVIATASQPESTEWCTSLGAHHVLDHRQPLAPQVAALGLGEPGLVVSTAGTGERQDDILELLAPQGRLGYVDAPVEFDANRFKAKCISIHPEDVFMRSRLQTVDMAEHGEILRQIGGLVDGGKIRTPRTRTIGTITAENLTHAHQLIERGSVHGKLVLEGF